MATIFDINAGCTIDSTGLIVTTTRSRTGARSSTGFNTGKKYFEVKGESPNSSYIVGLCDSSNNNISTPDWPSQASLIFIIFNNYQKWAIAYGSRCRETSFEAGVNTNPSMIGVAIDFNAHTIKIYFNNILFVDDTYGDKLTSIGTMLYPFTMTGGGAAFGTTTWNFGLKQFKYPVPTGYKAWDAPLTKTLYLKDNIVYGMKKVE